MSLQLEAATGALRQAILDGAFAPDERLREMAVAETLRVSRTLARLAMSALEKEGLLLREPNRGSRVKAFSLKEIADAIEVRGELEAMAVRLVAERGLQAPGLSRLQSFLAEAEQLLGQGVAGAEARQAWVAMNQGLHDSLIEAADNRAIAVAVRQISLLPLASASAIIFDLFDAAGSADQLRRSHDDHCRLLDAVAARQGSRAAAIMREHAFRSAENRRKNLANVSNLAAAEGLPGARLVRLD